MDLVKWHIADRLGNRLIVVDLSVASRLDTPTDTTFLLIARAAYMM